MNCWQYHLKERPGKMIMSYSVSDIITNTSSYIERYFPYIFLVLCFTIPFAKAVSGPLYVACIVLFAMQLFVRKEYVIGARKYYLVVLGYLIVIALSFTFGSNFVKGVGFYKQQCIVLLAVILIERVTSKGAARLYLYAYAAGGTVLASIGVYQGLYLNLERPPDLWYQVHAGNLLLMSAVVLIALFVSESSLYWKILDMIMLGIHGVALYLNGTRGVWIALAVVLLLLPFIQISLSTRRKLAYLLSLTIIAIVACNVNYFKDRISQAKHDIIAYKSSNSDTSLGARFEMWKASGQMFKNHPVFGVGAGAWEKELSKMVDNHEAPAFIEQFNQPHSIYMHALSTRGALGLLSLMLLVTCPVYYAIINRNAESALFRNVVILIAVAFLVAGLTDTLVRIRFVFMSYTAITGLGLAALFRSGKVER
jgi:O-antigen ligase